MADYYKCDRCQHVIWDCVAKAEGKEAPLKHEADGGFYWPHLCVTLKNKHGMIAIGPTSA